MMLQAEKERSISTGTLGTRHTEGCQGQVSAGKAQGTQGRPQGRQDARLNLPQDIPGSRSAAVKMGQRMVQFREVSVCSGTARAWGARLRSDGGEGAERLTKAQQIWT